MKTSKHEAKLFCLKMDFIEFLILFLVPFCVKTFRYMRLKKCNRFHFCYSGRLGVGDKCEGDNQADSISGFPAPGS